MVIFTSALSCARWEQETGEQIDLILQTGDIGIFPDESWLDWPTRRHAQHFNRRDPDQALLPSSMGLLRWSSREQHHFEIVSASWLGEYRPQTWREL